MTIEKLYKVRAYELIELFEIQKNNNGERRPFAIFIQGLRSSINNSETTSQLVKEVIDLDSQLDDHGVCKEDDTRVFINRWFKNN